MRRSLVLTDESARHWFRASLPPHARTAELSSSAEKLWQLLDVDPGKYVSEESWWHLTREDVRGFVSVYFAAFAAALTFIA